MTKKSILYLAASLIAWNSLVYASSPLDSFNEKLNKIEQDTIKNQKQEQEQEQENQRINEERMNDPSYMANKFLDVIENVYIKNAYISSSGVNYDLLLKEIGFNDSFLENIRDQARYNCDDNYTYGRGYSTIFDGVYRYVIFNNDYQLKVDQTCLSKIKNKVNSSIDVYGQKSKMATFEHLDKLIRLAAKRAESLKPRYLAAQEEAEKKKKLLAEEDAKAQAIANEKSAQATKQEKANLKLKMDKLCKETDNIRNVRQRLIVATKQMPLSEIRDLGLKQKYGITLNQAIDRCVDRMIDTSSYSKFDADLFEYVLRFSFNNIEQDPGVMCNKDKKLFDYIEIADKKKDANAQSALLKVGSGLLSVTRCVNNPRKYLD